MTTNLKLGAGYWFILGSMVFIMSSSCSHMSRTENKSTSNETTPIVPAREEVSTREVASAPRTEINAEIASSDFKEKPEDLNNIPTEVNEKVEAWLDYFQGRGSDLMERYLSRSGKYVPLMKDIFRREGLPEDLVYVALIESGFSSAAKSTANAVGFWQFIRSTGKRYGLQCDSYVDERRDFIKSTVAAADYFKGLYNLFGSWYLAIASYNVGENKIKNLVMKYHTRDFWKLAKSRRLPKETINYIPKFIAARMIAKEPAKYGFNDIEYQAPLEFAEVELGHSVDLRKLANEINLDYDELKELNPSFKKGIALDKSGHLIIRVPKDSAEKIKLAAGSANIEDRASIKIVDDDEVSFYRVRRGETLASIARKFRTTTRRLRALNSMGKKTRIVAGKKIKVPGDSIVEFSKADVSRSKRRKQKSEQREVASKNPSTARRSQIKQIHIVRKGESIAQIAQTYRVSVSKLIGRNQQLKKGRLFVGARLEIPKTQVD